MPRVGQPADRGRRERDQPGETEAETGKRDPLSSSPLEPILGPEQRRQQAGGDNLHRRESNSRDHADARSEQQPPYRPSIFADPDLASLDRPLEVGVKS